MGIAKIASIVACTDPTNASVEEGARPAVTSASWKTPPGWAIERLACEPAEAAEEEIVVVGGGGVVQGRGEGGLTRVHAPQGRKEQCKAGENLLPTTGPLRVTVEG